LSIAIAIAVVILVLHQVAESRVCVGPFADVRRYWWSLGSAGALIVCMFASWAVVFSSVQWRGDYGGLTLALSPVVVVIALFYAYMARLALDKVTLAVVPIEEVSPQQSANSHSEEKGLR
jgi:hypothetical protein